MSALNPPLISVVLPVFNAAAHLASALDSILLQTQTDFELLVVYDKSTDQSREILSRFEKRDARVVVLEGQGKGLVGALNQGFAAAKGEFIARMDADDLCDPKRFASQVSLMQASQLDLCGCHMAVINHAGAEVKSVRMPVEPDLITIRLACTVPFAHGSVMLRRSFLQLHHLQYHPVIAEDYDLWCRCFAAGARFGNVDAVLYSYRDHDSLSKVVATRNASEAKILRRQFIGAHGQKLQASILHAATQNKRLNLSEASFVILASVLISQEAKNYFWFNIARQFSLQANGFALLKWLRGF